MDITEIVGFVQVVPMGVALCVGFVIKYAIPNDSVNKFIPLISAVLGVGVSCWMAAGIDPETLLSGLVSGLAATGLYEAFRQLITSGDKGQNEA